ncbi:MAG: HU family DNA-binding protein [Bacteroidota bacterium]
MYDQFGSQPGKMSKKEFIQALAVRMQTDQATAERWVEAYTDTLFEAFKAGQSITIDSLGSFYLDRRRESTAFKFNPSQKLRALLGWASTYKKGF